VGRFPTADKEVHEYAGAHHTLEFEDNPEIFLTDLLRWLERRAERVNAPV
jgi:alpha-beta hydrolase superfamily lysophospholipase